MDFKPLIFQKSDRPGHQSDEPPQGLPCLLFHNFIRHTQRDLCKPGWVMGQCRGAAVFSPLVVQSGTSGRGANQASLGGDPADTGERSEDIASQDVTGFGFPGPRLLAHLLSKLSSWGPTVECHLHLIRDLDQRLGHCFSPCLLEAVVPQSRIWAS